MKKYIILIILFVLCIITIAYLHQQFFNNKIVNISSINETYNEIPANLRSKYKAEIEQIINEEFPNVIEKADMCVKDAKQLYKNLKQKGYNDSDYINLTLINETALPFVDLELLEKLTRITQEKYLNYQYQPIATDNSNPYYIYMYPYFKANNVDIQKIIKLSEYIEQKQIIIKNYIDEIDKIRKP